MENTQKVSPVEFAHARLDEDEAAAKAAASVAGPDWHHGHFDDLGSRPTAMIFSAAGSPLADMLHYDDEEMGPFIARHDPARVLRDVAAGRRILERHQPDGYGCQYCADGGHNAGWGCADLADLLTRWGDHPDYDQEWKP